MPAQTAPRTDRAQTTIDFLVGMSVFLMTVAFVIAFLPSVFEPFTAADEGNTLAADRTAALLAEHLLADPATPTVLDATCTAEFFSETDDGMIGDCRFTHDATDLEAALGVGPATAVNVTVEEGGTVHAVDGVELSAGPTPPNSESVVSARRVVLLDGEERDLFVRVW